MPAWYHIRLPLARKISILFGTAVLLTIGVTLTFPFIQMSALNLEASLMQAQGIATSATLLTDLDQPDWGIAQRELDARWPAFARKTGLPIVVPQLAQIPVMPGGFRGDAVDRLMRNPQQRYYWQRQDDGRMFRYALAIRGKDTDPHPQVLRGIVDVKLVEEQSGLARNSAFWNVVVTVLAGASGAMLALLVFYLLTQRLVLSPVSALRGVAEKVTRGDIQIRVDIHSGDEFESLAGAVNDMLAHLRAAQEELRKTNRSLDVRLGELAETNVALYESNRVKSEFIANVSHELRTPLVSIIGFAELLRDAWDNPNADRTRLHRYSENILTSGRSLLEIINDLLDLAKIEAGKMVLHLSEFGVNELAGDLIDFVRPLADKKNQTLTLELGENLPRMLSDSGKIKQILYNLLSNAIKFTPAEGAVWLKVESLDADRVRMTVRDTGPGIPTEQHQRIFDPFHQLDSSKTREFEGTGLGLAITRELVGGLGGTIRVESEVGQGATFVIELPVRSKGTVMMAVRRHPS